MKKKKIEALIQQAIAESNDGRSGSEVCLALPNDSTIGADGWALLAPFGEWPKTRIYRENGQIKTQKFLQVLDNESADALLARENTVFRKLKRALVGITVYKGHGDIHDGDPQALSNDGGRVKLGVVDDMRKTERGIEAHFALDNEGAQAVASGFKFPSVFWWTMAAGRRGDTIIAKPVKLISVALTEFPNISGVDSLANARPPEAETETKIEHTDMKLITGWLMANGIALPNAESATEGDVLRALQGHYSTKTGELAALGNEKTTLSGRLTALENDKTTLTTQLTEKNTALANALTLQKGERKGRAEAIADLAIARGKITVAEREAQITALCNCADEAAFGVASKALLESATKHNVQGAVDARGGKALANDMDNARADYNRLFQEELPRCGQDPVKAHNAVMKTPGLAEKLAVKRN